MSLKKSPALMKSAATVMVILLMDLSVITDDVLRADDRWTGWMGPDRDGQVSDFEPPEKWPKSLKQVWSVDVGIGYGSPLVIDNRIYQHARQGNQEVVWCLNRADGSTLWREAFSVEFRTAPGGEYHENGPKSSPVFADGRLFTMSINGTLTAWDASSGKQLWQRNYDNEFGRSHPNWGASTSPIVDGDHVIVHFGTDEVGTLVALKTTDGSEVWRHGKDGPSYSSPLVVEIDGVRQVVEWNHRALVGVDSHSGKFLWEFPFPHVGSDQNMPTPTLHNGRILLGGENRGIHSVRPQFSNGSWKVTDEWHQADVALDMSSAVINGDLLYGFSHYDSGRLFCLDPETGSIVWTGPPRTGRNVMLLSGHGFVAALINNGRLRIIRATGEGYSEVAVYRVAEDRTWAPPVLLHEGILIKDYEHLTMWSPGPEETQ